MSDHDQTQSERQFTVTVTESELTLLLSSLAHMEQRQLYLEVLAKNHGREREAIARRESAHTTVGLAEKLYAIGAKEVK